MQTNRRYRCSNCGAEGGYLGFHLEFIERPTIADPNRTSERLSLVCDCRGHENEDPSLRRYVVVLEE